MRLTFCRSVKKIFRKKVVYKCTPAIKPMVNGKKERKSTNKPVSIERIPLSIPAKLPKEVKEISKYFKTTKQSNNTKSHNILYAQALKGDNNTRNVLKIKETFPNLQANKIENIQKIIRGDSKPKPRINITTKGPSRKQVIVLMSNNNKISFMKDSSIHVTNLNRNLKNIKSDIIVEFICQETSGVTIVTNKVCYKLKFLALDKWMNLVLGLT